MTQPSYDARLPVAGDKLAGKYEIVRIIGEGGMGVVYEAMHLRLQQRVAIKLLQPRVLFMPDVVARFEREARAACRLRSRHAVRILDVDQTDAGLAYMVMEYLEGHDLSEELNTRIRLTVAESVDFVLQACVAMAEAHASGVVHRDLKPSNLFIVGEGGRRIIKVLDFGISKMTTEGEAHVTSTFATMGTPLYMSPEQIRSAKNVDARTDIWSLGVILYECLVGERPFAGTTTAAAAAIVADEPARMSERIDLPPALEQVVLTALAKKSEDRYADVRAFAEALAPFAPDNEPLRTMRAEAVSFAPRSGDRAPRAPSTPSFAHAATLAQTPAPRQSGSMPVDAGGIASVRQPAVITPPQGGNGPRAVEAQAASGPSGSSVTSPTRIPHISPVATTTAGWATQPPKTRRASRAKWGILAIAGGAVIAAGIVGWKKTHSADEAPAGLATGSTGIVIPANSASALPSGALPPAPIPTSIATTNTGESGISPSLAAASGSSASSSASSVHAAAPPRSHRAKPPVAATTPPASPASPPVAPAPTSTNPLHL